MDIGTLIGMGGALALVLLGIILGGGKIGGYIDPPSIVIVCGGTLLVMFAGNSLEQIKTLTAVIKKLLKPEPVDPVTTIDTLVNMCGVVRREGLLALDGMIRDLEDPFLIKGAQFVVDGADPDMTRAVLETDIAAKRQRHARGRGLLEFGGAMAPAFGMIGTLIGLVAMLGNLSDTATLGPKMAVALLTTFYGSLLANVFFLPGANKLKQASDQEVMVGQIIIEGLLGIQAGENPRNLEDKLKAFLPPSARQPAGGDGPGAAREAA